MFGAPTSPVKVIVVEDCEEDFHRLSTLLSKPQMAETYDVAWARSYEEGIDRLDRERYDVGLFDYSLGTRTGLDLMRSSFDTEMPVLLMTGVDNAQIDDEALRAGAADYLCKVGLTRMQLERAIRYARRQAGLMSDLRRTNDLLNSVLSSLPVIAGRIDGEGRILESRGFGLDVLGLREHDMVGRKAIEAWPGAAEEIRRALQGGQAEFTQEVVRNGMVHYFANYFRFDEERGKGAIGFSVNVTARVMAENERRRQAQFLDNILRNLPVVAGRLDAHGRVIEVRGEGLKRHQMAPADLLGRVLAQRFPQSRDAIAIANQGGSSGFTLSGTGRDGDWSVEFLVSFDQEAGTGVTFFGRDLTDRRRLERQLLEVSDAEQQRIGADLHDGLGQQLTGLACLAAAFRDRVRKLHPDEAASADRVAQLANDSTQLARALARGLSPIQLEVHGLVCALEDAVFQSQRLHNIDCTFTLRGEEPSMDHLAAIHLYRIVQEAVHNAVRHGEAKRIRVGLIVHGKRCRLVVLDNGRGFVSDNITSKQGRGLCLMQYRANMLGGSLSIRSRPDRGARVTCDWTLLTAQPDENRYASDHSY